GPPLANAALLAPAVAAEVMVAGEAVVFGEFRPGGFARARPLSPIRQQLQRRLGHGGLAQQPLGGGFILRSPVVRHVGLEGGELEVETRMPGGDQVMVHVAEGNLALLLWGADVTAGTGLGA